MWQYQNTDELYHHGVLGMKWGQRKAGNYAIKSGENYKKYRNIQNSIIRKSNKLAKKSITTKYNKNTNEYIHIVNMKKYEKGQLKLNRYRQKAVKYLNKSNVYKQKANTVINKYNVNNGKQYIKKMFNIGNSNAISTIRNATIIGGPIAGVITGSIAAKKK